MIVPARKQYKVTTKENMPMKTRDGRNTAGELALAVPGAACRGPAVGSARSRLGGFSFAENALLSALDSTWSTYT